MSWEGSVYGGRGIRRYNSHQRPREKPYADGEWVPAGITAGMETTLEEVEGKLRTAGLDLSGWIYRV